MTLAAASGTLLVALLIVLAPVVGACGSDAAGFAECLRDRAADYGLIPEGDPESEAIPPAVPSPSGSTPPVSKSSDLIRQPSGPVLPEPTGRAAAPGAALSPASTSSEPALVADPPVDPAPIDAILADPAVAASLAPRVIATVPPRGGELLAPIPEAKIARVAIIPRVPAARPDRRAGEPVSAALAVHASEPAASVIEPIVAAVPLRREEMSEPAPSIARIVVVARVPAAPVQPPVVAAAAAERDAGSTPPPSVEWVAPRLVAAVPRPKLLARVPARLVQSPTVAVIAGAEPPAKGGNDVPPEPAIDRARQARLVAGVPRRLLMARVPSRLGPGTTASLPTLVLAPEVAAAGSVADSSAPSAGHARIIASIPVRRLISQVPRSAMLETAGRSASPGVSPVMLGEHPAPDTSAADLLANLDGAVVPASPVLWTAPAPLVAAAPRPLFVPRVPVAGRQPVEAGNPASAAYEPLMAPAPLAAAELGIAPAQDLKPPLTDIVRVVAAVPRGMVIARVPPREAGQFLPAAEPTVATHLTLLVSGASTGTARPVIVASVPRPRLLPFVPKKPPPVREPVAEPTAGEAAPVTPASGATTRSRVLVAAVPRPLLVPRVPTQVAAVLPPLRPIDDTIVAEPPAAATALAAAEALARQSPPALGEAVLDVPPGAAAPPGAVDGSATVMWTAPAPTTAGADRPSPLLAAVPRRRLLARVPPRHPPTEPAATTVAEAVVPAPAADTSTAPPPAAALPPEPAGLPLGRRKEEPAEPARAEDGPASPSSPAAAPPAVATSALAEPDGGRFAAGEVVIRRGDTLWAIARRVYGAGRYYRTIVRANRGKIRNPDLIYPGQVFVIPPAPDGGK